VTDLGFTVRFHGPFRVGAAYARDGVDAAIDHDSPLPGDHLKGLMRAAARDVLGLDKVRVAEVFGGVGAAAGAGPCAWSWSAAEPDGGWEFALRHRVKVDPVSHSASRDHLVGGEQAYTSTARFHVTLVGVLAAEQVAWQRLVLRAAAAAVHGVGAWRRRGLGWVGIEPDEPLTDAELDTLTQIRAGVDH
jgi:hypothetical protein